MSRIAAELTHGHQPDHHRNSGTGASTARRATTAANANSEDRFLKLLVAQMQNQDPLNPMDNAQVTSQMAQISTVSGIEKLNSTVLGLNAQFAQLQTLRRRRAGRPRRADRRQPHASATDGAGHGGFELASQADRVKLEVLDARRPRDRHRRTSVPRRAAATASTGRRRPASMPPRQPSSASPRRWAPPPWRPPPTRATEWTPSSAGADGLVLELANAGPVGYDKVKVFD